MKYLIDAQLPPTLADWLRGRGDDATHLDEIGMVQAADQQIWDAALAAGAVLITKDRDFAEWAVARSPAAQVVWLRFGNIDNAILIRRREAVWAQVEAALASGAFVVETDRR